jgi:hypothetical protein
VREYTGQLLTAQAVEEVLEHLARRPVAIPVRRIVVVRGGGAEQGDVVDKDSPRAHLARGLEQHAVGRTKLLIQNLRAGGDDLDGVLLFKCLEIPSETFGIAPQKDRVRFEHHNQAGFPVACRPSIDELCAEYGLAAARFAFDQHDVAPSDAAKEQRIEACNACRDKVHIRHDSSRVHTQNRV